MVKWIIDEDTKTVTVIPTNADEGSQREFKIENFNVSRRYYRGTTTVQLSVEMV